MGVLRWVFLFALTGVSATHAETNARAGDVSPQITQAFPWIVAQARPATEEEKKRLEKVEAQKRAQLAEKERQKAEAQKRAKLAEQERQKAEAQKRAKLAEQERQKAEAQKRAQEAKLQRKSPSPAPVALPVPRIANVTPTQLPTSTQAQTITINGSGFDSGARVEWMYGVGSGAGQWRTPSQGFQILSNSQIRVSVLTGAVADQLRIRVTNSRGSSNQANVVIARAATAQVAQPSPPLKPSPTPALTSPPPSKTAGTTPQISKPASQPKPVTAPAPVALPAPQIANVTPAQLPTSNQIQTITINGSGFDSGARVEWMYGVGAGAGQWRTPLHGFQVLSNSQIRVSVLTGTVPGQLRIRVTNSRGSSNQTNVVIAKAAPAPGAAPVVPAPAVPQIASVTPAQPSPPLKPSPTPALTAPPPSSTAGTTPQTSKPVLPPAPVAAPPAPVAPPSSQIANVTPSKIKEKMEQLVPTLKQFPPPVVTRIEPSAGAPGIRVKVYGKNLNPQGALQHLIFESPGRPRITGQIVPPLSDTQIEAIIPPGSGMVDVRLETAGGTSDKIRFTYLRPVIVAIEPSRAPIRARTVIRGRNFGAIDLATPSWVKFGSSQARVASWGDTEIVVGAPDDYGSGVNDAALISRLVAKGIGTIAEVIRDLALPQVALAPSVDRDGNGIVQVQVKVVTSAGDSNPYAFSYLVDRVRVEQATKTAGSSSAPVAQPSPLKPSPASPLTATPPSSTAGTTPQTLKPVLPPAPATTPPALPVPRIANVTPSQLPTSTQIQMITINGSGFDLGARVEWMYGVGTGAGQWRTPLHGFRILSNSQIRVNVLSGSDPDQLRIRVTNSRGNSNERIVVIAKAAPAPVVAPTVPAPSVPQIASVTPVQPSPLKPSPTPPLTATPPSKTAGTTPQTSKPASQPATVTALPAQASKPASQPKPVTAPASVAPPVPQIANVTPSQLPTSTQIQTITINGSGFDSGARVEWMYGVGTGAGQWRTPLHRFQVLSKSQIQVNVLTGAVLDQLRIRVTNSRGNSNEARVVITKAATAPVATLAVPAPSVPHIATSPAQPSPPKPSSTPPLTAPPPTSTAVTTPQTSKPASQPAPVTATPAQTSKPALQPAPAAAPPAPVAPPSSQIANVTPSKIKEKVEDLVPTLKRPPPPVVTRIEPSAGAPGIRVKVYGKNLNPQAALQSNLFFEAVGRPRASGDIVTRSETVLEAMVPQGSGSVDVHVETVGGSSGKLKFTYLPPRITGIRPASGERGQEVQLIGENFGVRRSLEVGTFVTFGESTSLATSWGDKRITVKAPSDFGTGTDTKILFGSLGCVASFGATEAAKIVLDFAIPGCLDLVKNLWNRYQMKVDPGFITRDVRVSVKTSSGTSNARIYTYRAQAEIRNQSSSTPPTAKPVVPPSPQIAAAPVQPSTPKPSPTPPLTATSPSNTAGTTPQTLKPALQPAPVTSPPALPVPQIANVTPAQLPTSTQIQTITINGSGFDSGARVEWVYGVGPGAGEWRTPRYGYQVLSSSQIRVSVLTGADPDQLRIRVRNRSGSSNEAFIVFAKAATAQITQPSLALTPPAALPSSSATSRDCRPQQTVPSNPFEPQFRGYCTWYAADRWLRAGMPLPSVRDAARWYGEAQNKGFTTGPTPKPGSLMILGPTPNNSAGHVAYVESADPSGRSFTVKEMNWGKLVDRVNIKSENFGCVTGRSLTLGAIPGLLGFIYPEQPRATQSPPISPPPSSTAGITPQTSIPAR